MLDQWLSIRYLGSENSTADEFIEGPETSVWHVSGDAMEEEGVMLLPKPSGMYDTPVVTYWQQGTYGRVFQGFGYGNRDLQLGFQVYAGVNGLPDDWRYTDSLFRMAWAPDRLGRLEFATDDGPRYLDLQLLAEPTSYEGDIEQGQSPFLRHDATVIISAGGPSPNFKGEKVVVERVCQSASGSFTFEIENPGDIEMWPRWTCSSVAGGGRWILPDKSFGCDEYLRAEEDANRVWPSPQLVAGEHTVFDSDPRVEFARSNLHSRVWDRCDGSLMYPIPPHSKVEVTVSFTGMVPGDVCRLTYTPEFSRPWGVSNMVER